MLSDAKIRSLKPREKAYKVCDDRGLYMVVNPTGSRWRQLLARGIDPSVQRRTVKIARANTFQVIAEEWLEMQAEWSAPITMAKARWILGSFVYPRLDSRPITEITAPEVLAELRPTFRRR